MRSVNLQGIPVYIPSDSLAISVLEVTLVLGRQVATRDDRVWWAREREIGSLWNLAEPCSLAPGSAERGC